MKWSDVADTVESIAGNALPLIGGILGGPLGSKVGGLIAQGLGIANDPDSVYKELTNNPDALIKLKQIEADQQLKLAQLAAESIQIQSKSQAAMLDSVNKTIQIEAVGKNWLQRNAHPLCQLMTVGSIIGIYIGLPLAKVAVPSIPTEAWMMLGAILGIGTWHNGVAKIDALKSNRKD